MQEPHKKNFKSTGSSPHCQQVGLHEKGFCTAKETISRADDLQNGREFLPQIANMKKELLKLNTN